MRCKEDIIDLFDVLARLNEYYDLAEQAQWLDAEQPQLDGKRAIDIIGEGKAQELIAVLDRLDACAYL